MEQAALVVVWSNTVNSPKNQSIDLKTDLKYLHEIETGAKSVQKYQNGQLFVTVF